MKFKNVVEAVQWKGEESRKEVEKLIHPYILDDVIWTDYGTNIIYVLCYTKNGERYQESIKLNGWIIREKDGEIYTYSSENFEKEFKPDEDKELILYELNKIDEEYGYHRPLGLFYTLKKAIEVATTLSNGSPPNYDELDYGLTDIEIRKREVGLAKLDDEKLEATIRWRMDENREWKFELIKYEEPT